MCRGYDFSCMMHIKITIVDQKTTVLCEVRGMEPAAKSYAAAGYQSLPKSLHNTNKCNKDLKYQYCYAFDYVIRDS